MNLWTQQTAVWAIGPIAILARVNALARSYRCPYRWAVRRRLGDRQEMWWLTELDAFLTEGKLALHMASLHGRSARPRVQDLHAMERRPVHDGPRQFTSDPAELAIRSDWITSVHQSSPRTVTSLVTSRRRTGAYPDNSILVRGNVACLADTLQPARPDPVARSAHRTRPTAHPAHTPGGRA